MIYVLRLIDCWGEVMIRKKDNARFYWYLYHSMHQNEMYQSFTFITTHVQYSFHMIGRIECMCWSSRNCVEVDVKGEWNLNSVKFVWTEWKGLVAGDIWTERVEWIETGQK